MLRTSGFVGVVTVLLPALAAAAAGGEVVRLEATADIWVSAFRGEQGCSAGRYKAFKLKSIQEMAVVRFGPARAAGREVVKARLFLRRDGQDMLRYLRVSTVNGDWVEGTNPKRLAAGDGASYDYADNASRRPWSWPGSQLCDVIMGAGNTLATWAERKQLTDGWISVELTPELIYALAAGDSDGLAVMDGGTPKFMNNFIHSVQSASPPYIQVELGKRLDAVPARPSVRARPAPERAHLAAGAVALTIAPAENVFCWRVTLDGKPVPRWRIPHPGPNGPTVLYLDELEPSRKCQLEVTAVAPGGKASQPARLTLTASPALAAPPELARPQPPKAAPSAWGSPPPIPFWAAPPLVKVDPLTGRPAFADTTDDPRQANAVWDGHDVRVFAARGEYVSFQLIFGRRSDQPLKLSLAARPLTGPGGATIASKNVELYKCWYARNKSKQWQPAYCVPIRPNQPLVLPDPDRKIEGQNWQAVYVDIYVPKDARPGPYKADLLFNSAPCTPWPLIHLEVLDFEIPDQLAFWPQLNAYKAPKGVHDYYRLAHQHRSVFYYRYWKPRVQGAGKGLRLVWDDYDSQVGPLLSGEAFKACRRAGVPVEAMALPFVESWPTEMTKQNYNYQGYWPGKGDAVDHIIAHYMNAPHIGHAFSRDYLDAFHAAQRQFVEHFRAKGWNRTQMQAVFVSKNTHRINYGVNMWWTTDEPYHWDDWLALQFYGRLWSSGRRPGEEKQWVCRADISRPQWQGRVLDGAVDTAYFGTGAFTSPPMIRRCRTLARQAPLELRVYGSASSDSASNLGSVAWILHGYLNGASAALPWQTLGNEKSLDVNDSSVGGNALLAPGDRFGVPVVADMRLKAFRDAEQIAEYLKLVADRYGLNREQLRAMVAPAVAVQAGTRAGAAADNADALSFGSLKACQLAGLRRALAELILGKPSAPIRPTRPRPQTGAPRQ
ncbi:MAG: hypothetical protein AMJ81_06850 [Phycisphaerae bacterium SM23_33]|nr:MAG: hypothetical protein AMJ81_06850 [Phycisphaerae bacterium SM23_33]